MADGIGRTRTAAGVWLCLSFGLLACSRAEHVTHLGSRTTSKPAPELVVADDSDSPFRATPTSRGPNRYLPLGAPPIDWRAVRSELSDAAKRASRCGLPRAGSVTVFFRRNGTVRHVEITSGGYAADIAACVVATFRAAEVDAFPSGAVSVPATITP